MIRLICRAGLLMLVLGLIGCGEGRSSDKDPKKPGEKVELLPPVDDSFKVVLEAEDGAVEPAVVVEEFKPFKQSNGILQVASGGKCIAVPKDANAADKEHPKGKVTLKFSVPKDGKYYIHPRVWWTDGCANSFNMILDDRKPTEITDSNYKPPMWHWIKLASDDTTSNAPRAFKLTTGEHTLVFANREHDSKLDQVYITDNPEDNPAGIMGKPK